jgi:hypothetical protein
MDQGISVSRYGWGAGLEGREEELVGKSWGLRLEGKGVRVRG